MPHSISSEISQTDKEGIIRLNIKKKRVCHKFMTHSLFVGILLITLARALMIKNFRNIPILYPVSPPRYG